MNNPSRQLGSRGSVKTYESKAYLVPKRYCPRRPYVQNIATAGCWVDRSPPRFSTRSIDSFCRAKYLRVPTAVIVAAETKGRRKWCTSSREQTQVASLRPGPKQGNLQRTLDQRLCRRRPYFTRTTSMRQGRGGSTASQRKRPPLLPV